MRSPNVDRLKKQGAVQELIQVMLDDEHFPTRWAAAEALGELGDPRAVEPMIAVLRKKSQPGAPSMGSVVRDALVAIGAPAVPILVANLGHLREGGSPSADATLALKRIGEPSVEPLIAAVRGNDSTVRMDACLILREIGDPRVFEPMVAILKDTKDDPGLRAVVAEHLGASGDLSAVEPLIEVLEDKSNSMRLREVVASGLGKLGDRRAHDALYDAAKESDPNLSAIASRALRELGIPA